MLPLIVSIVTWNSEDSIKRCIDSLIHQTFTDFKILVVDNNSKDNTCNIVKQFNDPRLKLKCLEQNTGFCGGHNYALSHTESEFVLLVNPDAILNPDYIQLALSRIEKEPRTGTVCGLLVQSEVDDNALIDSAGMDFSKDGRYKLRHHGKKIKEVNLKVQEVAGADGALPLYRREMINDIAIKGEFFDEMFFAHKEDWDISWRSALFGWKTVFDPVCKAVHPRSFKPENLSVRKQMSDTIKYHAVKNQLLLLLKNEQQLSLDILPIISRQFLIFIYTILYERSSLKAYHFVYKNRKEIFSARKEIKMKLRK